MAHLICHLCLSPPARQREITHSPSGSVFLKIHAFHQKWEASYVINYLWDVFVEFQFSVGLDYFQDLTRKKE